LEENEMLLEIGFVLLIFGVALVFLGVILASTCGLKKENAKVEGGGVVLIGPIPIVFGTSSKWAVVALILAIVLMLLSLSFFLR
jgi:uncharacterized protein (TIGR00304 family)